MAEQRWLSVAAAAAYVDARPDAFLRLVRDGVIPKGNYALGERSPRWDVATLDAVFVGGLGSTDATTAFQGLANAITAKRKAGNPHRPIHKSGWLD